MSAQKWLKAGFEQAKQLNRPLLVTSYQGSSLCKRTQEILELPNVQKLLHQFTPVQINAHDLRDVDYSLMSFLKQVNGGGGGWPFHVVLSPQTFRPFLAASFLEEPQLVQFLQGSAKAWETVPTDCEKIGEACKDAIEEAAKPVLNSETDPALDFDLVEDAELQYGSMAKLTPRFIMAPALARFGPELRGKLLQTIGRSGMIDHLNGGVFSYSLSTDWHLPSFEKRLEDQATLLSTVAAQLGSENVSDREELIRLGSGLVKCIRAFFTGKPRVEKYLWTHDEFHTALKAAGFSLIERDIAESFWGVNVQGNVNDELQESSQPMLGDLFAQNVLSRYRTPDEVAQSFGVEPSLVISTAEKTVVALAKAQPNSVSPSSRCVQLQPNLHELKTDRRGLVLSALASVSPHIPEAQAVLEHLIAPFVEHFDVDSPDAVCSDFANMIRGVRDYLTTVSSGKEHLLEKTRVWQQMQDKLFRDKAGSYYYGLAPTESTTVDGIPMLYVRPRFWEDGTVPNYQGVTLSNLNGSAATIRATGLEKAKSSPLAYLTYTH